MHHGGTFKNDKGVNVYIGGGIRTFTVDPDELCWFNLEDMASSCGKYTSIDAIYWLVPGLGFEEGLKRLYSDDEVRDMLPTIRDIKSIDCYVVYGVDVPNIVLLLESTPQKNQRVKMVARKKLTPKKNKNKLDFKDCGEQVEPTPCGPNDKEENDIPITQNNPCILVHSSPIQPNTPCVVNQNINIPPTTQDFSFSENLSNTQQNNTQNEQEIPFFTPSGFLNSQPVADVGEAQVVGNVPIVDKVNEGQLVGRVGDISYASDFEDPGYTPENEGSEDDSDDDVSFVEEGKTILEADSLGDGESNRDTNEFEVGVDDDLEEDIYDDILADINNGDLGLDDLEEGTDDEEVNTAIERLRKWNEEALKRASQVQREAAAGILPGQERHIPRSSEANRATNVSEASVVVSDYLESSEENTSPGSGDELVRKKHAAPYVDEHTDFKKFEWVVGIKFPSREKFRDAVIKYAVVQGRNLTFYISAKAQGQKLAVKCVQGCQFNLYGSWDKKTACFVVKTVKNKHSCRRTMEGNKQLKSPWLAKQFLEVFKVRPHWPAKEIVDTVKKAYSVIIKPPVACKVRHWAHKMLHGSMKEHYSKVGSYIAALESGNSESQFVLETIPRSPPVFQRMYVCFEGLRMGWLAGCRRFLCVDACFLKTFLGGQLISVVGRDPNDQMFPLAWAVVEGENNDSYVWFFQQLKASLGEQSGDGWTIVSDQHQSIAHGIEVELPKADHRICARHLYANWKKNHKGDELKLLFWNCVKSYNMADFNENLEEMRKVSEPAAVAFVACNPKLFCRAYVDASTKCDVVTSNMAETFNAYIIHARTKHLISMLEDIRTSLMHRIVVKNKEATKWAETSTICPRIVKNLEKEKDLAANCNPLPSTLTVFQVTYGIDVLTVDLKNGSCTCRKWDVTGIPCCHAISCIFFMHEEAEEYVHDQFKIDTHKLAYSGSISPCVGERYWPKIDHRMDPPPIKIGPGRPRKNRRRDPYESPSKPGKLSKHGSIMSCSVCKSTSHNKRKCPFKNNVVEPPPKRSVGRPRKSVEGSSSINVAAHHQTTAQPSRLGRGGRVIMTRRGNSRATSGRNSSSVAGGRGAASGQSIAGGNVRDEAATRRGGGSRQVAGRGGRDGRRGSSSGRRGGPRDSSLNRVPQGFGIFVDNHGNHISNEPRSSMGSRQSIRSQSESIQN